MIIKKILKKLLKLILILILLMLIGYFIIFNYAKWKSSKKINELDKYVDKVDNINLEENINIVALGEATHGNKEFQELKLEIFKQLVEKQGYKALLFEMDYGEGLFINDFIQGKSNLTIDEIIDNISFDIYKTNEIKELIMWMKNYNLKVTEEEKISFYGFDFQNPDKSINYIIDNLDNIDNNKLEILSQAIKLKDEKVQEAIEYLKTIHTEDQLIDYSIQNALNSYDYFSTLDLTDYVETNNKRDKLMADNILWIYEYEKNKNNNKIMISGHNGHIAKYDFNYTSMGSILKEELKDSYYALGTDYFNTTCNIKYNNSRINIKANSASILAYQSKYYDNNRYFLNFSKIKENNNINTIINSGVNHGVLGEGYSPIMKFLPQTTRIKIIPTKYYDGMIFIYEVNPLDIIK